MQKQGKEADYQTVIVSRCMTRGPPQTFTLNVNRIWELVWKDLPQKTVDAFSMTKDIKDDGLFLNALKI